MSSVTDPSAVTSKASASARGSGSRARGGVRSSRSVREEAGAAPVVAEGGSGVSDHALSAVVSLFVLLAAIYAWAALLSFDIADPPGLFFGMTPDVVVAPGNVQISNWCGATGAWLSFRLFYYLGTGSWVLAGFLGFAAGKRLLTGRLGDLGFRMVGVGLMMCAVAVITALPAVATGDFTSGPNVLLVGDGGILGLYLATRLHEQFAWYSWLVVLLGAGVGLLLAADDLLAQTPRAARWVREQAAGMMHPPGGAELPAGPAGPGSATDAKTAFAAASRTLAEERSSPAGGGGAFGGVGTPAGRAWLAVRGFLSRLRGHGQRGGASAEEVQADAAEDASGRPGSGRKGSKRKLAARRQGERGGLDGTGTGPGGLDLLEPAGGSLSADRAAEADGRIDADDLPDYAARSTSDALLDADVSDSLEPVEVDIDGAGASAELEGSGAEDQADEPQAGAEEDSAEVTAESLEEAEIEPGDERPRGSGSRVQRQAGEASAARPQIRPELIVRLPPPKPNPGAAIPRQDLGDYKLPPLDLLDEPDRTYSTQQEGVVREKGRLLQETLDTFRIDAKVVRADTGPVITMFEVEPSPGVKVATISNLANDIARSLRAPTIRIVAPIPGKNTVGIEVPNDSKEKVRLKELFAMVPEAEKKMALPVYLGKDASGNALVTDLTKWPHGLVAGTTGSGKSVCINTIIMSVLMTQRPDDVKLILVDPKMVEMSVYKDVPHLLSPIITDMAKAQGVLEWAVSKMEERYGLLAEAGVRDIRSYNRLGPERLRAIFEPSSDEEEEKIPAKLPYILIIIDEFADLMMTNGKDVEQLVARLAQKSRAVGIHVVLATQRPSANVVTGLIKSNLPTRIAFRVASRTDSRIVLDQNGAEVLMGQGDMLYLPPGASKLVRSQGTFIEDDELHSVLEYLKGRAKPEFSPELMGIREGGEFNFADRDELFDDCVRIVLETQRGSVSLLQRKLGIGYARASRIIEQMADAGVLGSHKNAQAREVLITLEQFEELCAKAEEERMIKEAAEQIASQRNETPAQREARESRQRQAADAPSDDRDIPTEFPGEERM